MCMYSVVYVGTDESPRWMTHSSTNPCIQDSSFFSILWRYQIYQLPCIEGTRRCGNCGFFRVKQILYCCLLQLGTICLGLLRTIKNGILGTMVREWLLSWVERELCSVASVTWMLCWGLVPTFVPQPSDLKASIFTTRSWFLQKCEFEERGVFF